MRLGIELSRATVANWLIRVARDFLSDYKGYVQSDGYAGYNALENIGGITLCGCWAHARRKFVEVAKADKSTVKTDKMRVCDIALQYINKLYSIEHEAKVNNLNHEELRLWRLEKIPVTDKENFKELLSTQVKSGQIDKFSAKS